MKYFYSFLIIAFVVILGFACTQEKNYIEPAKTEEQKAFEELQIKIEALNAEFGVSDLGTRANYSKRKRIWRIFGADLIGGLLGYIKGNFLGALRWGGGSSIAAAKKYNNEPSGDTIYVPERALNGFAVGDMANETDATMSRLDSIGYYHNQIICDLYDEYGLTLFDMNESTYEQLIDQRAQVYAHGSNSNSTGVVIDEAAVNDLLANMEDDNIAETFETLNEILPEYVQEFQIVQEYCETIITFDSDEELIQYAQAHNNLLQASTISEYAKSLIGAGTGTGTGSIIIWNPIRKPLPEDELDPIEP